MLYAKKGKNHQGTSVIVRENNPDFPQYNLFIGGKKPKHLQDYCIKD